MIKEGPSKDLRQEKQHTVKNDLVVVGGGMAGTCCAIMAAREGLQVTLVQDRPVLGGNASSEIRLWILGATSHMGNNNRWSREGGIIDEILVENMYRNPEGNPIILDTILLEKVSQEKNITLLLNTAVYDLSKENNQIKSLRAFCSQNSTFFQLEAPLFVDASGDGIVGFMSGAAFRMGAEPAGEFDEKFAPDHEYGELLGHSLYFYSKDVGKQVTFVPPAYALTDIEKLPRFRSFNLKDHGCRLWWVEYGGRLDTIHESEKIKWELWRVIYGIWHHIKNSGEFENTENLTLEWVGTIPGKRESRRFEGDYMLSQKDVVEQRLHTDAISYGGWALDLHPADGVYGNQPGCNQWHSKGVYQIPYRCMYSRNISNLFLAGRIISASHVAFGSSRVMATCAHNAQAVGMAAVICRNEQLLPRDLLQPDLLHQLQQRLISTGHYIPGTKQDFTESLLTKAQITTSSQFQLQELPADGPWYKLDYPVAQLLPLPARALGKINFWCKAENATEIEVSLRRSEKTGNYTPETTLSRQKIKLAAGEQSIELGFDHRIDRADYYFITFAENKQVYIRCTETRISGLLTVFKKFNKAVSNYGVQEPPAGIGVDTFEFWVPERRPAGHNLAFKLENALDVFGAENLINGWQRPLRQANAWIADFNDPGPRIQIKWPVKQTIKEIILCFDTDFDHAMESTLMGHPEQIMPFCVREFEVMTDDDKTVYTTQGNHQTISRIQFQQPVLARTLTIKLRHPLKNVPAAVFAIKVS